MANFLLVGMFAIMFACLLAIVYELMLLQRNERVYQYRTGMLEYIFVRFKDDTPEEFTARIDAMNAVPYVVMLNKWWKPLDSFYEDRSFMEPKRG